MKIDQVPLEWISTNLLNHAKPQSMLFMYLELFQICTYALFTYIYEKIWNIFQTGIYISPICSGVEYKCNYFPWSIHETAKNQPIILSNI